MFSKKNTPGDKPGCVPYKWQTGIAPTGDCFVLFESSTQHFNCTMDAVSMREMGKAMIETANKRESGWKPAVIPGSEVAEA